MSFEESKEKIISVVKALFPTVKIYLYGSRARKDHGKWSDIDIALDGGKPLNDMSIAEINDVVRELHIPYKAQIIDFHQAPQSLKEEIVKDRVIWKD
jgi:predicted nucleotidyltransferase